MSALRVTREGVDGVSRETRERGRGPRVPVRPNPPGAVSRETAPARPGLAARIALLPLRAYRRFLSPALAPRCRYYPSCSAYAEEAIRELGAIRGTILAAWRLLRCNPFSKGGIDPVSDRRLFRPANHPSETA